MSYKDVSRFPSGRSIERVKQDAKKFAKQNRVPYNQALNILAEKNGMSQNWHLSVKLLRAQSQSISLPINTRSPLARELGISDEELEELDFEVDENASSDGLIYNYILRFSNDSPKKTLRKIQGLSSYNEVSVSVNAFDEPDMSEDFSDDAGRINTDMNPYRKLLVHGLNVLLSHNQLSLDWQGDPHEEPIGHLETIIAGENSVVLWQGIRHGEVRISVWWKYNHSLHPQAYLEGDSKETFVGSTPLARRKHYSKFVGVVCSCWLERQTGKYLQGKGQDNIFKVYTRKGELEFLKSLPNPKPQGYAFEGPFHP